MYIDSCICMVNLFGMSIHIHYTRLQFACCGHLISGHCIYVYSTFIEIVFLEITFLTIVSLEIAWLDIVCTIACLEKLHIYIYIYIAWLVIACLVTCLEKLHVCILHGWRNYMSNIASLEILLVWMLHILRNRMSGDCMSGHDLTNDLHSLCVLKWWCSSAIVVIIAVTSMCDCNNWVYCFKHENHDNVMNCVKHENAQT